nr:LlaJI family restriction endonuclease [Mammaliicoccus sp. Marseille-Q6498]
MISFMSFIEGQRYSKENIPSKFIQENYFQLNKDGTVTSKVCGISILDKQTYLFLPKGFNNNLNSDYKLNIGKKIFKSLVKYKESIRLSDLEAQWLGNQNKDVDLLDTIEWLLEDYFRNGFYREVYKKQEMNGRGKIDWARTIKLTLPVVVKSKMVFLDLITNKNQINTNTVISAIHTNIISECSREFGWLYDKKIDINKVELPISIEQQIIILKIKLREVFSGYEVNLLQNMIKYLEASSNDETDINLLTPYYYYVWEEMLKNTLEHNAKLQKFVPKPYWKIDDKIQYSKQIPDVLIERNDSLIILDAKYYSITTSDVNKYPGWESIVKQMYYNISLNHLYENIQNIFIMPEVLSLSNKNKYIGKAAVQGKEDKFGYVYAFSIDLELVLQSYLKDRTLNYVLEDIINNLKNIENK